MIYFEAVSRDENALYARTQLNQESGTVKGSLEPDCTSMVSTVNNLGGLYNSQSRLEKAERI
jgi:hypothetical protein